ncbi:hypothetical protein [Nocardioides massiliensis]|nr:hypothetical protein [Nocardioides massiliensis]
MPELGRQAAHVLVDMVSVSDPGLGDSPGSGSAVPLAARRFNEIEAVSLTVNDETEATHLDMSYVLGPTAVLITWLVRQLELHAGVRQETVLVAAREFLDSEDT